MRSRLAAVTVGALVALAVATPSSGQGKSGKAPGKGPTRPPSSGTISPQPTSGSVLPGVGPTTTPFAWLDDASVLEPGNVSIGLSMTRWQGSGFSQTSFPVVDTGVGLARHVQLGVSAPRVAGGLGTMFISTKVAVFTDDKRALAVAVGPTLEVDNAATPPGQGRVQWGLPISAQLDRGGARVYGSTGYFSPGIWYAGAGIGGPVNDRIAVSASFSRAWVNAPEPRAGIVSVPASPRNELSGGASYDVTKHLAAFGSLGRTYGVTFEEGAGTTFGFGLSWSIGPAAFTK
jgi:hypothetical protein